MVAVHPLSDLRTDQIAIPALWPLDGIGTLFSIAILYVVTSIVLKLTVNVAAALWSADIVNSILDTGSEGISPARPCNKAASVCC